MEEIRWNRKKGQYLWRKKQGFKVQPIRRGRTKTLYPTKKVYDMSNPRDVAEVKKFKWFSPLWSKKKRGRNIVSSIPSAQSRLTNYFPYLLGAPRVSLNSELSGLNKPLYIPHFREPEYVRKEMFCEDMSEWAWAACRPPRHKVGNLSHIFYLNDFSIFDSVDLMESIGWSSTSMLPSDIIRLELFNIIQGFGVDLTFFRMIGLSPLIMDYLGIKMTHKIPSSHRYSGYLKQIGVKPILDFFNILVAEARGLGLIKDQVHIWDGQFHEVCIKSKKPRKKNLAPFYGGVYNHGGKKVGVGVYQSTIMDWNGICTIPIHTEIVPANRNENPAVRETVRNAYVHNPVPDFFLMDKGPSGMETQESIARIGARPIAPVSSNTKNGVIITNEKELRFYKKFVDGAPGELLEKLYNIRTRIEEHYSLNDNVFNLDYINRHGKSHTQIKILLANCLSVLIALTAYKIGRPDLMWSPSQFREQPRHPEEIFPYMYRELNNLRWDEDVCISPRRYPDYISKIMQAYQKQKN